MHLRGLRRSHRKTSSFQVLQMRIWDVIYRTAPETIDSTVEFSENPGNVSVMQIFSTHSMHGMSDNPENERYVEEKRVWLHIVSSLRTKHMDDHPVVASLGSIYGSIPRNEVLVLLFSRM
jgi:hypothetical protein